MQETIAAISTSRSPGGIGIVRLSGEDAIKIASSLFRSKENLADPSNDRKLLYGHFEKKGETIDEVLAVAFHEPNSYTRENMVEIQCHGGPVVLDRILEAFLSSGAEPAEPGEFTRRAFLNGRMDLTQAEAVMDIIDAQSIEAQKQGMNQLEGSLSLVVEEYRQKIVEMLSLIVANIDFPTDEVDDANYPLLLKQGTELLERLERLRESSKRGKIIRDGIKTVIVGKPNVGKSSLLNRLLRENRVIVTDVPGTTRDIIEEFVRLDGATLRIQDTAGIRETDDIVEKIGIEKALESIDEADLVLAVFDQSQPLIEDDYKIIEKIQGKQSIVLLNKEDLPKAFEEKELEEKFPKNRVLSVSMLEEDATTVLEDEIKKMFLSGDIKQTQDAVLTNMRHKIHLDKAISSLESAIDELNMGTPLDCVEVDLNDSYTQLGYITGMTVDDEILDAIFSKFCIGK
ncbi:tRNA uridine-5-carboxymethylaminomethyl(34) synthesis GTPase MnmE [Peptoniphilus sp. KCTC 25270]|uniref:tRNA uridine-5-carboxymethylaminomethyl(34) synthesis GTPase MnmE n=1 Tax=Peptoniphilus sp. KCTC 25270 TaxID=2897414 RepID=UPI001E5D41EC|nr:tRNA uridine-5-carboxymethylaminomethyl(34) synthesis GTPase MnmE [Peptoniphilus sp. KCTC 25270]MCD1147905.1 tRNA uridine-5-carboxymethylaminomethyl(34) synthesis GTPase MnmE [Peptoniphilus sp. KCTC 25270]